MVVGRPSPLRPGGAGQRSTLSRRPPPPPAATPPASGQWHLRAPGVDASGHDVRSSINIEPAWAITHGDTVHRDRRCRHRHHPASRPGRQDAEGLRLHPTLSPPPTTAAGRQRPVGSGGDSVTAVETTTKNGTFSCCNDVPRPTGGRRSPRTAAGTARRRPASWARPPRTASAWPARRTPVPVIAARALGKRGGYYSDIIAAAHAAGRHRREQAWPPTRMRPPDQHESWVVLLRLSTACPKITSMRAPPHCATRAWSRRLPPATTKAWPWTPLHRVPSRVDGQQPDARRDRRGGPAPRGHQGQLLLHRQPTSPSPRRAATASTPPTSAAPCLYPILTTRQLGHHDARYRRRHRHHTLRRGEPGHQLLHAALLGTVGADAVCQPFAEAC